MNGWKNAFELTKYELKRSTLSIFLAYLAGAFFLANLIIHLPSYLEEGTILYDFLFVLIFGAAPLIPKPKEFGNQHIREDFMVSPFVIMQLQLPISNEAIIKNRFLMQFLYSFPVQLMVLLLLYILSPLQEILSVGSFIAFTIIWLSFSIYVGFIAPRISVGMKGFMATAPGILVIAILVMTVLFFGFTFIHVFFEDGIVYWSIVLAEKFPIMGSVISLALALIGYHFWKKRMNKTINSLDYL